MAATATAPCEEQAQLRRERRPCGHPRGLTIGEVLTAAHEQAAACGAAECPVCGGELAGNALEARCAGCGSRLL